MHRWDRVHAGGRVRVLDECVGRLVRRRRAWSGTKADGPPYCEYSRLTSSGPSVGHSGPCCMLASARDPRRLRRHLTRRSTAAQHGTAQHGAAQRSAEEVAAACSHFLRLRFRSVLPDLPRWSAVGLGRCTAERCGVAAQHVRRSAACMVRRAVAPKPKTTALRCLAGFTAQLFGRLYRCCASEFHALSNDVYRVSTIVRTVVCCVNVACRMNVACCMNGACCCVARRTLHAVARQPSAAALPPNTVAENTHRHCSGSCGVQGERLVHKHVGDRRVRSRHGNHHLRRRRLPGGAFVSRRRRQRKQADLRLWADQGALQHSMRHCT